MGFRPTRPGAARLLRLGVMLDTRNAPARFREIARMCDRAGVDALWVADPGAATHPESPRLEAWTALVLAALETSRAQVGAMLEIGLRPAELLASMVRTLGSAIGDRLAIGCRPGAAEVESRSVAGLRGAPPRELGASAPDLHRGPRARRPRDGRARGRRRAAPRRAGRRPGGRRRRGEGRVRGGRARSGDARHRGGAVRVDRAHADRSPRPGERRGRIPDGAADAEPRSSARSRSARTA